MTQSAANESLLKQFPVKQGINREFLHFEPLPDLSSSEKATDHKSFSPNSLRNRSGNPDGRSGNHPG
jgi:hypothetical protein